MTEIPASKEAYEAMLATLPENDREGFERLMSTLKPWETLDPELAECLVELHGTTFIKHPLLFVPMYVPGVQDGSLNETLATKKRLREEFLAQGQWWQFIFLIHERPYQLTALLEIADQLDDEQFSDLVGDVWTESENAYEEYEDWREVFESPRLHHLAMMDDEERASLQALPETLDIYRGARTSLNGEYDAAEGFSYTLKKSKAKWFADRFKSLFHDEAVSEIIHARVAKTDVIAYFVARGEEEIVVLPEKLKIIKREEIA